MIPTKDGKRNLKPFNVLWSERDSLQLGVSLSGSCPTYTPSLPVPLKNSHQAPLGQAEKLAFSKA